VVHEMSDHQMGDAGVDHMGHDRAVVCGQVHLAPSSLPRNSEQVTLLWALSQEISSVKPSASS
jgi:hypothetical protein